jgi:hypothetical protein
MEDPKPAYRFKVHIGYTASGRNRYRRFATMDEATKFCNKVFRECGNILSIVMEAN